MDAATPNAEKLKALQAAMAKIEKDFGRGSVMRMGDEQVEDVEVIPTGSLALDAALGVGGYPKGRIIEIYGPESSSSVVPIFPSGVLSSTFLSLASSAKSPDTISVIT